MSLDFGTVKAAIALILAATSELPEPVQQSDGAWLMKDSATQAEVSYRFLSIADVGESDNHTEYDPDLEIPGDTHPGDLGGIINTVSQNITIVVQVNVECEFQDIDSTAHKIAQRIRRRMNLPTTYAAFGEIGLGLQGVTAIQDTGYNDPSNGHAVSRCSFDLIFNAVDGDTETFTTIESAEVLRDETLPLP